VVDSSSNRSERDMSSSSSTNESRVSKAEYSRTMGHPPACPPTSVVWCCGVGRKSACERVYPSLGGWGGGWGGGDGIENVDTNLTKQQVDIDMFVHNTCYNQPATHTGP
jgi:hypothetical protein